MRRLRDDSRNAAEVLDYLESENKYADSELQPLQKVRRAKHSSLRYALRAEQLVVLHMTS